MLNNKSKRMTFALANNMTSTTTLDRKIKVEALLYEIETVTLSHNMYLSLPSLRSMAG